MIEKNFYEFDIFMNGIFGSAYINLDLHEKRLLYLMMVNDNIYLVPPRK